MAAYPPIEDLVPHAPPMRAVEELIEWSPGHARCRMIIRAHSIFARGKRVPTTATLEFMAQAVAACLGYDAFRHGGHVRVGMLVGVRQMDFLVPFLNVGDVLLLEVERIRGTEDASTFYGQARVDGDVVATAQMTFVHPAAPPD